MHIHSPQGDEITKGSHDYMIVNKDLHAPTVRLMVHTPFLELVRMIKYGQP